ncbi:MAG TPA: carbohydrate ABC transporter permease [Tepidisphaeraceae bacterium]|nr:carbohydrate ABC transporter permease [Tepidisphaeraceae bacterium]
MRITNRERIFNYLVLCVFTAFTLVPLIGVLLSALTPRGESGPGFAVPDKLDFGNFLTAWNSGNFSSYLTSSILVTAATVALTVVLAVPAAFAFARFKFPGSKVIFFVILIGLMIPEEAFIIPLYYNLRGAGLTDSYWSLILPQAAWSLGFTIFWMRNFFLSFPGTVVEAARLDGAADRKILWYVLLPAARPAIATACLLVAMWTWNEFLMPLVMISGESMRTAPLALAFFKGQHVTDYSLLAAAGTLIALPIVLLYLIMQRHFIAGMLSGAVKG